MRVEVFYTDMSSYQNVVSARPSAECRHTRTRNGYLLQSIFGDLLLMMSSQQRSGIGAQTDNDTTSCIHVYIDR